MVIRESINGLDQVFIFGAFKSDGLYTATRQNDGTFRMTKTKITKDQYEALKAVFQSLDNNGFTPEENKRRRDKAQEETGAHIK